MTAAELRRVGGWKLAVLLGKVALSSALFAYLFGRIPRDALREAVSVDRPAYLWAALGLFLSSTLLGSYQWGRLLRAVGLPLSFARVCSYYHVGLFFNNFLPANIGGDIARVVDASRHASGKATALSTVVMDRTLGMVALGGLALVTAWPAMPLYHLEPLYFLLVAFFACGLGLLWATLNARWLLGLEGVLRRVGLGRWVPRLERVAESMATFRRHPGPLAGLLGVALLTQLSRVAVHALAARALGIVLPLHYFFLFVPLLAVLVSLPISFNGIGVREGAGIVLFGMVGVDRAHAFSLQVVTYLIAVAVSLLGGLVFISRIPRRRRAASAAVEGRGF